MTRVDNIIDSFKQVADIAYENLPPDIAVFCFVYVRDRNNKTDKEPDWEVRCKEILKWMSVFDIHSVRELIDMSMNEK